MSASGKFNRSCSKYWYQSLGSFVVSCRTCITSILSNVGPRRVSTKKRTLPFWFGNSSSVNIWRDRPVSTMLFHRKASNKSPESSPLIEFGIHNNTLLDQEVRLRGTKPRSSQRTTPFHRFAWKCPHFEGAENRRVVQMADIYQKKARNCRCTAEQCRPGLLQVGPKAVWGSSTTRVADQLCRWSHWSRKRSSYRLQVNCNTQSSSHIQSLIRSTLCGSVVEIPIQPGHLHIWRFSFRGREVNPFWGALFSLSGMTKKSDVLQTVAGAVVALTRLYLVRVSVVDLGQDRDY